MQYMQVIEARDLETARRSYLDLLANRGIALHPATAIFVETVHRPTGSRHEMPAAMESWLCYLAAARPQAA